MPFSIEVDREDVVLGADLDTLYHVADTWANYDKLKPVLDDRFQKWKAKSK